MRVIRPLFLLSAAAALGSPTELPRLDAIPRPLTVRNAPVEVRVTDGAVLKIAATGGTNLFRSPAGGYEVVDAPMAVFGPDRNFILTAKVAGVLRNVYDVGALVLYEDERTWAKLCYENSAQKEPTIVSVVTRGYSDDCNSTTVDTAYAYMAIARKGEEISFHYSRDGKQWRLVRHFRMAFGDAAQVGFAVHGSRGDGFEAAFSEILYRAVAPKNMRQLDAADLQR